MPIRTIYVVQAFELHRKRMVPTMKHEARDLEHAKVRAERIFATENRAIAAPYLSGMLNSVAPRTRRPRHVSCRRALPLWHGSAAAPELGRRLSCLGSATAFR